jgi:phosphoglycerol transferase MdoB-like AlkP superfamily enzyme
LAVVAIPPMVVLGPTATARVETWGLHRNVFAALVTTAFPRVQTEGIVGDSRTSPFAGAVAEDLSSFRGTAAGRNVVLITLESTAAQYLRPFGAIEDPMPHVTELAAKAICFDNAYAVYPESIKGLFSVLCSTSPAADTSPEAYEQIRTPALAEVLARAGYRTGLFHSGRFGYLGMEAVIRGRGFQTLEDAGDIGGDHQSSFGLDDERQAVRRILAWIDGIPRGERFFVHYLPIAGHHPYNAPEPGPFSPREAIGRYRNALHHADSAIAELVAGLRQRHLEQDTLLVLYGDHGEAFGQHSGNFAHTLYIYNENIHVPLVIVAPGPLHQPRHVRQVASLLDIAPTILDLLGQPTSDAYQGCSLLDGRPRMALFFTDYSQLLVGLCDGGWKYIGELETGRSKLFQLDDDPSETRDRSDEFPERVQAYQQHLRQWSAAQRKLILTSP